MNSQQAKQILALCRPGTADEADLSFSEALRFCEQDPEVKTWFAAHCAQYAAIRGKFKQVPVPEGLKEQILAERRVHTAPQWRRPAVLIAALAVVAVLAMLASFWLPQGGGEDLGFTGFLNRMASTARRGYGMELATNNPAEVRAYLARKQAPADYSLPASLQSAALNGCAITDWQGAKVSMICFYSGRPLPPGQTTDLWLFVADPASVQGAPASTSLTVTRVSGASAASWTAGGRTYVLVADGNEEFLRKYL